jgi:hypothetical protein
MPYLCCSQPKHEQFVTTTESALRHQPASLAVIWRQGSLFGMVPMQLSHSFCYFSECKSVNQYHESTAMLSLFHDFPSIQNRHTVQIDISQLLDTFQHENLQIGAWLNVIGYITPSTSRSRSKVQAILVWSAGAINLQHYETALVSRQTT